MDLTGIITADGTYSLRVSDSVGGADYSSKEGANSPTLLVSVGGASPQSCAGTGTATPTPGPSSTPTNTPTPGPSPTPTTAPSSTPTSPPPAPFNNATFVYDGEGKRVKSTFNGTTSTYFVGTHYEVTGSTITKYYYAGAQRIAMRTNGTLNYLLGDHLGSTSLTTDASGQVVAELRYRAWGETRYSSGTTPTDYQYTGQYSYAGDFGLLFYNARWYDPALGRFVQADSIVAVSSQGLQAFDHYAYVTNSPVRFTDPSGHTSCEGPNGECNKRYSTPSSLSQLHSRLRSFGVKLTGNWSLNNGLAVFNAVEMVAERFAVPLDSTPGDAFREVYGITADDEMEFEWVEETCAINGSTCWGFTPASRHIQIFETYFGIWDGNPYVALSPISTGLILHEMGHAFNQRLGGTPMAGLGFDLRSRTRPHGFFADSFVGQFSTETTASEIFADMFVGWGFGMWGNNDLGDARREYMESIDAWIINAAALP